MGDSPSTLKRGCERLIEVRHVVSRFARHASRYRRAKGSQRKLQCLKLWELRFTYRDTPLFKEVCAVMAWSASVGGFEVLRPARRVDLSGHSAPTLKLQFQEVTWQKYLETPASPRSIFWSMVGAERDHIRVRIQRKRKREIRAPAAAQWVFVSAVRRSDKRRNHRQLERIEGDR
ncbi:unnamed protein product [Pleuronectes platessa]|uniref:Uncharacterized protein n=1 Tax=Pleuronectes platessa TaxID=8262 RepID=A0A9N7UNL8_PLEPL|nr:unnamed protein product [Pleuronectes platessa]